MIVEEINKEVAMDMVLEYLIKQNRFVHIQEIEKNLFHDVSPEEVHYVMQEVANLSDIAGVDTKIYSGFGERKMTIELKSSSITKQFLDKYGGFKKYYSNKIEAHKKQIEKEDVDLKLKLDTIRTNQWSRIGVMASIIISILALSLSVYSLVKG